jgi:hypothetical protein
MTCNGDCNQGRACNCGDRYDAWMTIAIILFAANLVSWAAMFLLVD